MQADGLGLLQLEAEGNPGVTGEQGDDEQGKVPLDLNKSWSCS
jgi:hypothetical protein